MSRDVTLTDVLRAFLAEFSDGLNTAFVGRVTKYFPLTQVADIKPIVRKLRPDVQLGEESTVSIPTLPCVPIAWPGGGSTSITFDLSAGDVVLCIVTDRSIEDWQFLGTPDVIPQSDRRFDLSDVIAIPCIRPMVNPLPPTAYKPGSITMAFKNLCLGSSAAVDAMALASIVDAHLATIVTAFNLHTHGVVPVPIAPIAPLPSVGSSKVKVDG
jgi:hypothetical protein